MTDRTRIDMLPEVIEEIKNCEEIQNSNESAYTKEQAKISAYEHIRVLLGIYREVEE